MLSPSKISTPSLYMEFHHRMPNPKFEALYRKKVVKFPTLTSRLTLGPNCQLTAISVHNPGLKVCDLDTYAH